MGSGLSWTPEIFQHEIQKILQGIPDVKNMTDDIIVCGLSQAAHFQTPREVFQLLREKGHTLNQSKCAFNKPHFDLFGYTFSAAGVFPASNKLSAIENADTRKTASEVRSFFGQTIAESLRRLTQPGTTFLWSPEDQQTFDELKARITIKTVSHY